VPIDRRIAAPIPVRIGTHYKLERSVVFQHYFRCAACGYHVTYCTQDNTPVQPGRTHGDALSNGAVKLGSADPSGAGCLGVLSYCSGMDIKTMKPCVPTHAGTKQVSDPPPPPANPDWSDLVGRVQTAWQVYVNSGYAMAQRGPNHDRSYRPGNGVRLVLQGAGGVVNISGATYTVSNSLTSDASLKRNVPGQATFIFHL